MNRFGSDVVAWVGILGGGAVTVAATAAFLGTRGVGPAPTASVASSACAPTAEASRELRVSTVEPRSGVEGPTVQYVFRTPCSTSEDETTERRIRIHVSSKSGGTHVRHVPLIATIERTDDAKAHFEALSEYRKQIADAERRLAEVRARVELRRSQADVGVEEVERLAEEQEELAERVRELVRKLAEVEEGGAP